MQYTMKVVKVIKTLMPSNLELLINNLEDNDELQHELNILERQLLDIQERVESLVTRNARVAQNQKVYQEQYNELVENYQHLQEDYIEKKNGFQERRRKINDLTTFINIMKQQETLPTTFDRKVFNILTEQIVIFKDKKVDIHFKNGQVISM